jgi:hypothetical protein
MRLSWLLLFSLAACSPYSFSKEVADLSAGVDQLSSGFTSGFSALAADRAAKTQLELTGSRARVHVASACLDQEERTAPCELHELGTAEPTLSGVEQLRGKTMSAVAVLRNYAHALAAVTNAADRTAYEAAVAQLSGSVGALAKNADAAAPGASIVAPAAVNLAGFVVGTALDQQRFESLKAGVTAVGTAPPGGDSPIATVTKSLGEGLGALSEARQEVLIAEAQILAGRLVPSLSDTDYRQGLSDAQAVVAVLDGLRQADPEAAARALVTAHDALLAAVNDPRRNYASLLQAVSDFADQAASLQAALATAAELEKAAAKKES